MNDAKHHKKKKKKEKDEKDSKGKHKKKKEKKEKKDLQDVGAVAKRTDLVWLDDVKDKDKLEDDSSNTFPVWIKVGVSSDSTRASDWGYFSTDDKEVLIRIVKDVKEGTILEIEEKGIIIFTAPHRCLKEVTDSKRYFLLTVPNALKGKEVSIGIAFHDRERVSEFVKKIWSTSLIKRPSGTPEAPGSRLRDFSSEWLLLADETLLLIFEYLSAQELCALGLTCSRWQMLVNDNHLWKGLCKRAMIEPNEEEFVRRFHGSYKLCYVYHIQMNRASKSAHVPDEKELLNRLGIQKIELDSSVDIKCVVVGDGMLMKQLIHNYTHCETGWPVVVLNSTNISWLGQNTTIDLAIYDTAGQEEYDRLRPLSYVDADTLIITFSLVDPVSFQHVIDKWYPEVRRYRPDASVILVGMQPELRADPSTLLELRGRQMTPVITADALRLASKGFSHYVECSLNDPKAIKKVFELAVLSVLTKDGIVTEGKKRCLIS